MSSLQSSSLMASVSPINQPPSYLHLDLTRSRRASQPLLSKFMTRRSTSPPRCSVERVESSRISQTLLFLDGRRLWGKESEDDLLSWGETSFRHWPSEPNLAVVSSRDMLMVSHAGSALPTPTFWPSDDCSLDLCRWLTALRRLDLPFPHLIHHRLFLPSFISTYTDCMTKQDHSSRVPLEAETVRARSRPSCDGISATAALSLKHSAGNG